MLNGLLLQLDVLIDDSGKYVLRDFGLSRAKADAIGRTVQDGGFIVGCRNWMTPDRLRRFIEEAFRSHTRTTSNTIQSSGPTSGG